MALIAPMIEIGKMVMKNHHNPAKIAKTARTFARILKFIACRSTHKGPDSSTERNISDTMRARLAMILLNQ